ncbi:MAG: GGDEF domain-containing protein [Gammaproteobacteria bacterium HGW-Gammaproteobacteria-10]|nr:MAG: GGDEF domain-containing protein [Gammaproteobacteria bacterium HGW-Gammaproteobacteria-10]HBA66669.1 GGDEF domain-containing protein [Methylococcaceae bacterium]
MINPHRLSTQLLRHLYRHSTRAFAVHCVHTTLFAVYLWFELTLPIWGAWLAFALIGGFWHWYRSSRALRLIAEDSIKGDSIMPDVIAAGVAGLSFGITALLFPLLSLHTRLFIFVMLGAVAAAAMPRLSTLPSVYAAFLFGIMTPLISILIVMNSEPSLITIPAVLIMGCSLFYSAHQLHSDLLDGLLSRFGLENEAGEDKLTHLANRRRFDIVLEQEWLHALRSGTPLSLIMLDVDFFKKFNDRYGHQDGDDCLEQVAGALAQSAKRAIDLVARYGGEEFVVLLSQTTRDDAYTMAERMRQAVERLNIPHQDSTLNHVTISLGGFTTFAREDMKAEDLVKIADKALYRAKATGRNRVVWYDPNLDETNEE